MVGRGFFIAVLVAWAEIAGAQTSLEGLFVEKEHDFGSVARAAKVEHAFVVKNTTNQTLRLTGVRSSCGCTQPRLGEKTTLAPGETGEVIARFNTLAFTGKRGAWLTVTFDKPNYAEARLRVNGYIRTDVVFDPGLVSFGSVPLGSGGEKRVKVAYAGRGDWKIESVKSSHPHLVAQAVEQSRSGGRVNYELIVTLKPDAPVGYLADELTLVTNDRAKTQVPVKVEGVVAPSLSISPSPLLLGTVAGGAKVTKQLIVRGVRPFRILELRADDAGFSFVPSQESKSVHIVPLTFTAGTGAQALAGKLTVVTDMPQAQETSIEVRGQVAAPLAGN